MAKEKQKEDNEALRKELHDFLQGDSARVSEDEWGLKISHVFNIIRENGFLLVHHEEYTELAEAAGCLKK